MAVKQVFWLKGGLNLSNMKLGDAYVFSAIHPESYSMFLNLIKEYSDLVKKSADARLEFEKAKKLDKDKLDKNEYTSEDSKKMEEGDTSLDSILSKIADNIDLANEKLDACWKIYKKDKSLKHIIKLSSKKDLEERIQDATLMKMLQNI